MGRLGKDWKVARRCSHVLASAAIRVGVTATNASLLSVACERALERDARHPRDTARRGAARAPRLCRFQTEMKRSAPLPMG